MKLKIEMVKVKDLLPYALNAKLHDGEQIKALAASIREFGFVNPVLIDEKGVIIAGHGRVHGATHAGLVEVPCIRLDHLAAQQVRAYRLADNRLAELGGGWDLEVLVKELAEIDFGELDAFRLEDLDFESVLGSDAEQSGEVPAENEAIDEDAMADTKHECPKCGFKW